MKLSLSKKFGWVHVLGGRLLRVELAHAVPTSTWCQEQAEAGRYIDDRERPPRFARGQDYATCAAGDLAIEIVAVKTGKVLGYSYLSGPAIQLHCYTAKPEWFSEATGQRMVLERPGPERDSDFYMAWAMRAKYGPADLYAVEFHADSVAEGEDTLAWLDRVFSMVPNSDHAAALIGKTAADFATDEAAESMQRSHVLAVIHYGPPGKGGGLGTLHVQPPSGQSDFAAVGFQIALVLSALPLPC